MVSLLFSECARVILCIEYQQEPERKLRFTQAVKHAAHMCQQLKLGRAFLRLSALTDDEWKDTNLCAIMAGEPQDQLAGTTQSFLLHHKFCIV